MSKGTQPQLKRVIVKVQTVTTIDIFVSDTATRTIGNEIDQMLRDLQADNHCPNRVTIDLNPPDDNPATI